MRRREIQKLCEKLFCRYVDHQRDMGVVLGERDIRREIMKHRGRLVRSENLEMWTFCCQAPIAGEMCRSCRCTSDCGYFLPLLTSVAEKPTNDFFKMKDTTFPFSHLQQLFSFDKNLCLKWRRKLVQYYSFSYFKQFFSCPGSFYTLVVFVVSECYLRIWTQFIL